MLPISGSRKIAGIYKQIEQATDRISEICDDLDDARSDCFMTSLDGENEEAIEAEQRYLRKLRALMRQVKVITTLGRQIDEEIHKAD